MPINPHKSLTDEQFERYLLESAQRDSAPGNIDEAWAKFANVMQHAAAGIEAGSGLHQAVRGRSDQLPDAARIVSPSGAGPALQWLLVGALAGSVITATAMLATRTKTAHPPTPQSSQQTTIARSPPVATSTLAPPRAAPADDVVAALARREATVLAHSRGGHAGLVTGPREIALEPGTHTAPASNRASTATAAESSSPTESSSLAEQVRRLDAARTALAVGNNQAALRAVDDYHRDFPAGALSLDADVVAIEALAAQHNAAEVARRAAKFLAQHPADPHAARVKWLAEH